MPLLKQFKTPFGTIRIIQNRDGTRAYYQNGSFHSQANKRGVSICAYAHVVSEIARQKKARKVLVIGCGGGTLPTMLRHLGAAVTVVDINEAAFTIARDYFRMPKDVMCVTQDGLLYVRTTKARYDAVVIDVFGAENKVPAGFTAKAFFADAGKILKRNGVVIMNVMAKDHKDRQAQRIAKNLKASGLAPTIYDWSAEDDRNIIIAGGPVNNVAIPSGKEPAFIRKELKALLPPASSKMSKKS